ncbi:AbrB/MazE/SpoVT family DNA-binding domain-containing protein [bacterium]|nr:AbrB/MazE/SpoVT family DNA-binding domain-containing protein [bacterium]
MSTTRISSIEQSSTLVVQEDPTTGELFIELPERLLRQLGWKEGDGLEWLEQPDGSWAINKIIEDEESE